MNKENYFTLSLTVPIEIRKLVKMPKEIWMDLTAMFSELATHPEFDKIAQKHLIAMELLEVMP
jgi:hypothetical protein